MYNNSRGTGIKCLSCNNFTHNFQKCPQVTYKPNCEKVIYVNNKSEE